MWISQVVWRFGFKGWRQSCAGFGQKWVWKLRWLFPLGPPGYSFHCRIYLIYWSAWMCGKCAWTNILITNLQNRGMALSCIHWRSRQTLACLSTSCTVMLVFGVPLLKLHVTMSKCKGHLDPIPSMYGIFTYIWLIFLVNVGKYNYTIHGLFGDG